MKTYRIKVYGRVQGVNFRSNVKLFADGKGITGYVTNKENGSVLIITRCEKEKLDELTKWLEGNPGFSKVEKIKVEEIKVSEEFNDFRVIRNGNLFIDKFKSLENFGKRIFREN